MGKLRDTWELLYRKLVVTVLLLTRGSLAPCKLLQSKLDIDYPKSLVRNFSSLSLSFLTSGLILPASQF